MGIEHTTDRASDPSTALKAADASAQLASEQALTSIEAFGRTKYGTKDNAQLKSSDPGLGLVMQAWLDLPEAMRAGIVAMVQASTRVP